MLNNMKNPNKDLSLVVSLYVLLANNNTYKTWGGASLSLLNPLERPNNNNINNSNNCNNNNDDNNQDNNGNDNIRANF